MQDDPGTFRKHGIAKLWPPLLSEASIEVTGQKSEKSRLLTDNKKHNWSALKKGQQKCFKSKEELLRADGSGLLMQKRVLLEYPCQLIKIALVLNHLNQ